MTRLTAVMSLAGLAAIALAAACGRTEIEPPFDASAAGGSGGTGGASGTGGHGGIGGIPGAAGVGGGSEFAPIQCGSEQCTPVTQACCVGATASAQRCIVPTDTCAGASFSCIDSSACPANQICCFGYAAAASVCSDVSACPSGTAIVLCTSILDCPAGEQHCCPLGSGGSGVCSPQPCP
jgi:hypothetical protein